jgi:hypothetical protein
VWDAFFSEGNKILFRVGLALLKIHEPLLLQTTDSGTLFNVLRTVPSRMFDCEKLLDVSIPSSFAFFGGVIR